MFTDLGVWIQTKSETDNAMLMLCNMILKHTFPATTLMKHAMTKAFEKTDSYHRPHNSDYFIPFPLLIAELSLSCLFVANAHR